MCPCNELVTFPECHSAFRAEPPQLGEAPACSRLLIIARLCQIHNALWTPGYCCPLSPTHSSPHCSVTLVRRADDCVWSRVEPSHLTAYRSCSPGRQKKNNRKSHVIFDLGLNVASWENRWMLKRSWSLSGAKCYSRTAAVMQSVSLPFSLRTAGRISTWLTDLASIDHPLWRGKKKESKSHRWLLGRATSRYEEPPIRSFIMRHSWKAMKTARHLFTQQI